MPAYVYSGVSYPAPDVGKFYLVLGAEYTPASGTANNYANSGYLQLDVSSGSTYGLGNDAGTSGGKLSYDLVSLPAGSPNFAGGLVVNKVPSTDVRAISVRRGRTRDDQGVDVGEMTVEFLNLSGAYDPDNVTTSPWRRPISVSPTKTMSWLAPGTFGALFYGENSTTFHCVFAGVIESVEADQSRMPTATVTFVDNIARLGRDTLAANTVSNAAFFLTNGLTTAQRMQRMFEYLRWQSGEYATSGSRKHDASIPSDSPLTFLESLAACEGGRIYCDRNGIVRLATHTDLKNRAVALTLTDSGSGIGYDSLTTIPMHKQIINRAVVLNSYGKPFAYTEPDSAARHGVFAVQVQTTMTDSVDNSGLATFLGKRRANPQTAVSDVSLPFKGLSAANKLAIVKTDLGDKVSVSRTTKDGRALSVSCWVEGIEFDLGPASWRVTYHTSSVDSETY